MKKLTNKKGFTLVEMLVVIAIIAVLVAIIIPTVSSATTKAKAATDAANLRSALATATIMVLDDPTKTTLTHSELNVPQTSKSDDDDEFSCEITAATEGKAGGVEIKVYYGNHAIEYYSSIADGATAAKADKSHDKSSS